MTDIKNYRNYTETNENYSRVENTYRMMILNNTYDYVLNIMNQLNRNKRNEKNIWELFKMLDSVIDESDPDNDLPQIVHAYQTCEAIINNYFEKDNDYEFGLKLKKIKIKELGIDDISYDVEYLDELYPNIGDFTFLIIIGLIHDLGKILALDDFGKFPQWSTVGDTFPVGLPYSESCVFYEKGWHNNLKTDIKYSEKTDIKYSEKTDIKYSEKTGFDNMLFSFGHDEYLAKILELSTTLIPKEGIYMVRYHSFYSWHTPKNSTNRGYQEYASEYDIRMLPLLKILQKADLYSKSKNLFDYSNMDKLMKGIICKYMPNNLSLPMLKKIE